MTNDSHDELVTLTTAESPIQAHAIGAVLEEAEINAVVLDLINTVEGGIFPPAFGGVQIKVRRCDFERAAEALKTNIEDSIDIDWDEIDIGQREDNLPLGKPGRMPPAARIAFIVAVIVLLVTILASIVVTFLR